MRGRENFCDSYNSLSLILCVFHAAKKAASSVQLAEGEKDVINLEKVEGGMTSAINMLKQEYATSIVTRITPCKYMQLYFHVNGWLIGECI